MGTYPFILGFKLTPAEIGERLIARRKERGLSQMAIAKACGLSQNSVAKIERGQFENSRFIPVIWEYLGLDRNELLKDENGAKTIVERPKTDAYLIDRITYEEVLIPSENTDGIMVTWHLRDGKKLRGVVDRSLLQQAIPQALEVFRKFGLGEKP